MLPQIYRQNYEAFQHLLKQLQAQIDQPDLDPVTFQTNFLQLQQFLQLQILTLTTDETAIEQRVQPYQTEISKQLRLLGIDITFLQAARQTTTKHQRQAQMQERLQLLIRYCEALLTEKE